MVRPSVTAQGVSGIETVISGVYIGAYWDEEIGPRVERFEGLPRPPLTPADQPGLRVRLRAPGRRLDDHRRAGALQAHPGRHGSRTSSSPTPATC